MGTFNAGAIEADLTLNRSPFQRHLDEARAQAAKFEADDIEKDVDLSIAGAMARLRQLQIATARADGDDINMDVDIDTTAAFAQLALLETIANSLDGKDIDMDANVRGNAMSHFSRFEAIVSAVILLLPLVPPVAATATAAVVGLASAATAAAGALGVIALGVGPTVKQFFDLNEELNKQKTRLASLTPGSKEYNKQLEKIRNLQREINDTFGPAADGFQAIQREWQTFQDAIKPEAIGLIGDFLDMLAALMPSLTPIFKNAAPALAGVFRAITDFADSPAMAEVVTFFADFGTRSLVTILQIGGNVLDFLFQLFRAFAPFGTVLLDAIRDVTGAWADWARTLQENQGFQDFIDYVMEDGPKVWELIVNIVDALINIGVALAPVGALFLDAFNWFFDFIGDMDPTILGAIAVGIGTVVIGLLALTAATAALNAIFAASPIGLIIIGVLALAGAVVYLWNTNEGFREAVINTWNRIYAAVETVVLWFQNTVWPIMQTVWNGIYKIVEAVVNWFTGTFVPTLQGVWDWLVSAVTTVVNELAPIFTGLKDIVVLAFQFIYQVFYNIINGIWQIMQWFAQPFIERWDAIRQGIVTVWNFIVQYFQVVWNIIKTVFQVAIGVIATIVKITWEQIKNATSVAWNVIKNVFVVVWNLIKAIVLSAINVVKGILQAALAAMKGDFSGAWNAIKGIFSNNLNIMLGLARTIFNAIKSVASTVWNGIKTAITIVLTGIVNAVRDKFNAAKQIVSTIINGIKGLFTGAGTWLINAGRSIISGLIEGIKQMFGRALDIARGLLGQLRDLLPFSPAKKGPFSGKGWTLYSGQAIVEGLMEGMHARADALKRTAAEVLSGATPGDMVINARTAVDPRRVAIGDLSGSGGGRPPVEVHMTVINPVAERSSESATTQMTRLAQLGAFS